MPGMKLLTKLEPQACIRLAWRVAQDQGYTLTPTPLGEGTKSFTAEKGSVLFSMLVGAFAPHCHFRVSVESYRDANEVVLEPNKPWLTSGAAGVSRVQAQAQELMQAIASAIERDGGVIMERKEF